MQALKLIQIGNSVGVIFPEEIMTKLKLKKVMRFTLPRRLTVSR